MLSVLLEDIYTQKAVIKCIQKQLISLSPNCKISNADLDHNKFRKCSCCTFIVSELVIVVLLLHIKDFQKKCKEK